MSTQRPAVYVVGLVRSPIGQLDGQLSGIHPVELLSAALDGAAARYPGARPEHLVVGCNTPAGAQGWNLARAAVLTSELPEQVTAEVVSDLAGSGHLAFAVGEALVRGGMVEVVAVGGVDVASTVPGGADALGDRFGQPWGSRLRNHAAQLGGCRSLADLHDLCAQQADIDWDRQDAWRRTCGERARRQDDERIVPIHGHHRDELPPTELAEAFLPQVVDALRPPVLAPPADGAAVALLASTGFVERTGATPLAVVRATWRLAGLPFDDVSTMTRAAEDRRVDAAELAVDDRSAARCLATIDALGIDQEHVNLDGGFLGNGDPGGAGFLLRLSNLLSERRGRLLILTEAGLGQVVATVFDVGSNPSGS